MVSTERTPDPHTRWPAASDHIRLEVPALPGYARLAGLTASGLALRHGFASAEVEAWRAAVGHALDLLLPPPADASAPGHREVRLAITFDLAPAHLGAVLCWRGEHPPLDPCACRAFARTVAGLVDTVEVSPDAASIALGKRTTSGD